MEVDSPMPTLYLFFLWELVLVILVWILGTLVDKRIIGYPSARWGATFAFATLVIPASRLVGWPFAIGLTLLMCTVINYVFWGTEQIEIELVKKRLREEKAGSGS